jgi:predicted transposase YbfD/YdcC
MHDISPSTIVNHFSGVDDPRIDRTKEHLLIDILTIAICAVICGADGWVDTENYGKAKYDWLKTFLALPNGIPSHDTFGRVFARINPQQFQSCFMRWVWSIFQRTHGEVIPIDGKTLRHSFDTTLGQRPIHMVSAWAVTNRLVLGQLKVADKSNEITAIPELLKALDVTDCIVTIDAIGCQKPFAAQIIDQKGQFVLSLKENQPILYADVQAIFTRLRAETTDTLDLPYDYHETVDNNHGRREVRRYWTTSALDTMQTKEAWQGLQSIGMTISEREVNGTLTTETRYYISSLPSNAAVFGNAVRSHWNIENAVHWVLDIAFREDDCRIRLDHGPENFALLRHIALNMLRRETSFKGSIKSKRLRSGWNDEYLAKVLRVATT